MKNMQQKAWINVRQLRKARGWPQWKAAEMLGVAREYISLIENGRRGISMSMMKAIIQVFGVSYDDFFQHENKAQ